MSTTGYGRRGRTRALAARRAAVERAEAYLRLHMDAPVTISTLCGVVGLSERGLRNAFYSIRGMSPARYRLAQRLRIARKTLTEASAGGTTVTTVAMGLGFYELGRFAAIYKAAFGEAPSETLRTSRRAQSGHTGSN
jgi:transcriptional regulator GlxA family with amidase domain